MHNVSEIQRRNRGLRDKKVKIYNPDTDDFTVKWHGQPYTVRALEISKPLPFHIANHIKKHLANHLLHKRGVPEHSNITDTLAKIKKEIEVI